MPLGTFGENDPIKCGALIELEFSSGKEWFFLLPAGGGIEVSHAGVNITTITPESPLGSQMLGARSGSQTTKPPAKIGQVE
jgi:hypothetical protein